MALDGSSTSVMAHNNPYHSHVSDYYGRKLSNKPDVVPSGVTERKVSPSDKPDMVVLDVLGIKDSGESFSRALHTHCLWNISITVSFSSPEAPGHRKKHETDTYVLVRLVFAHICVKYNVKLIITSHVTSRVINVHVKGENQENFCQVLGFETLSKLCNLFIITPVFSVT